MPHVYVSANKTIKEDKAPDTATSERVVRIAGIITSPCRGFFCGQEDAVAWLKQENRALGGGSPLSMLDTGLGAWTSAIGVRGRTGNPSDTVRHDLPGYAALRLTQATIAFGVSGCQRWEHEQRRNEFQAIRHDIGRLMRDRTTAYLRLTQ